MCRTQFMLITTIDKVDTKDAFQMLKQRAIIAKW